jgi:putative heme-binding domain-containing protein
MAAVERGAVPKEALTADVLRQLRSLKDAPVNGAIQKVYGTFRETTADKQKSIEKYKAAYSAGGSTPGDAPRGRAVFNRICAQCHALFDVGGKVGPDLTGSNRSDLDYLLQNMVDPNAVIPNEYRSVTIDMKDDRVITGVVKSQDQNSLTVATATETLVLPRGEVASMFQGELSMMPEGLLDTLKEQEVRDLIYYLRQPVQASLPGEGAQ